MLYEVLSEFDRRMSKEKLQRGMADFTDNKRFALNLFVGEDGNPTDLAREYSEKFDEIYIDEYQDTDSVQDMIFSAISVSITNTESLCPPTLSPLRWPMV